MNPNLMQSQLFSPLDAIPVWLLFLFTVLGSLLALEAGLRLGRYRQQSRLHEQEAPVGGMVAAILGLLAFMLAFTFGMAGARFEERKRLVLDEANAIGTTYLRAELLPEPAGRSIQQLLREYVDVRISGVQQPEKLAASIARSEALHTLLWAQAVALGQQYPGSIPLGLFVQSLNEVIDLHTKRITAGLRNRIPTIIWAVLYLLAVFSMMAMGYYSGIAHSRRSIAVLLLTFAFSIVIQLTVDLDRGGQGVVRVSQQAMIDLQQQMRERAIR